MRFLIVGDLHGQMPKLYRRSFDAIIAPGDFCSDEAKSYMYQALRERLENPSSARHWYDIAGKRRARQLIKRSVADGRRILEHLDSYGVPVYIVPGNWDWTGEGSDWAPAAENHYASLTRWLRNVVDVYHRRIDAGDVEIIGIGIHSGPEYPQSKADIARHSTARLRKLRREFDREYKHLSGLFRKARNPVVFISHNVPYDTPLDRIDNPASPRNGQHYGSVLARQAIKEYAPVVCVGGHMHEHFASCRLGRTLCINAGLGGRVNVLLELQGGRVKTLEFIRNGKRCASRT